MAIEKMPSYGGQALIEGVVMRGSKNVAAAMRAPDGSVVVHTEPLTGIYTSMIRKIPILRGLVVLWDALGLGMKYLTLSANIQSKEDEKIEGPQLVATMVLSLAIGIGIFFLAPAAIAHWIENLTGLSVWYGNLFEGIIRLIIMVGYIWGIGFMPDIQRVFQYHGAEHKTINAFESNCELTPENVKNCSLVHPRCGTSFLLTVVVFSIIIFSLLGPLPVLVRLLSRILMIPLVAGLAYEYIKWTAKHLDNPVIKILIAPNLAMQKLTTREPSLDIIEISIIAFKTMLKMEDPEKGVTI